MHICGRSTLKGCGFTGQVVGVHGLNPSGSCLVAQKLITSLPRPFPASSPTDLQRFAIATGARTHAIFTALHRVVLSL